jgi:L-ascorbate metabolism protein UlaG (beta-lactamase superfamily)
MQNTITDRHSQEQTRIRQRRKEASARYPQLFESMAAQWNSQGSADHAWLMYSANYYLRTAGVRWAMDPLTMRRRVPETPAVDVGRALAQLDFVLLTHRHADHLDFDLLKDLRHLPIQWVIPDFILQQVQAKAALPENQIITPYPLQPFCIKGIRILPFSGRHWEASPAGDGGAHGVPAIAYLVEFNGKRWLFPGDTRNYDLNLLPSLGPVDGLFAHLWLGRGCALMDDPPLLDAFCRFCAALQPKRAALTHLEEFGREADDYWDDRHARQVVARLGQIAPRIPVQAAYTGERLAL